MDGLKIAVATDGPVPDNQCALKDAVLTAAAANISDHNQIVQMAQAYYQFLTNPAGGAGAVAAPDANQQAAAPVDPSTGQPVQQ